MVQGVGDLVEEVTQAGVERTAEIAVTDIGENRRVAEKIHHLIFGAAIGEQHLIGIRGQIGIIDEPPHIGIAVLERHQHGQKIAVVGHVTFAKDRTSAEPVEKTLRSLLQRQPERRAEGYTV